MIHILDQGIPGLLALGVKLPALLLCIVLGIFISYLRLGGVFFSPQDTVMGGWTHPDSLGNHWLLVWVAEQISQGHSIIHNDKYYLPIGDAPWLAGNGSEGFLFLPFYLLFGWPMGAGIMSSCLLVAITYAGRRLAISVGADEWSSLIAGVGISCSGYLFREMSCGRFTQANIFFLLMAMGSICLLTREASAKNICTTALWSACCAIGYWYYGLFFIFFALAISIPHIQDSAFRIRLAMAGLFSMVLTAPVMWFFIQHWSEIPGTEQSIFPPTEAIDDALSTLVLWDAQQSKDSVQVQSLPIILLGFLGLVVSFRNNKQMFWGLFTMAVWGGWLSFGPHGKLYLWVYQWTELTKRFWWPSRHIILLHISWAVLAALGTKHITTRISTQAKACISAGISLLIPLFLWAQGQKQLFVPQQQIQVPTIYTELASTSGTAILQPPLSPHITFSQEPLIQQLYHNKKLITGHALWVDRVRPKQWDDFVQSNALLYSLQQYEEGRSYTILSPPEAITEIRSLGVDWVVLDQALFTKELSPLFESYVLLWSEMLGSPKLQNDSIYIWSMNGWNGTTSVDAPKWIFPKDSSMGNGTLPIEGQRLPSSLWKK